MKKFLLILLCSIVICGCSNVKNLNYDQIIETVKLAASKPNTYRTGYKYFMPRGLGIDNSEEFNESLFDGRYKYYLYVDVLSYIKKIDNKYQTNTTSFVSKEIINGDKYGYLEINLLKNNKYLIEIMYNYAKIEVIVEEDDINSVLLTSVSLLRSIDYNESIIANLFGKNILNYLEEEFNIFNTTSNDSTYIKIDDTYHEPEVEIPDTDLIN